MPRSNNVGGCIAVVIALALLSACASASKSPRTAATPPIPPPPVAPPVATAPPPLTTTPPLSVGPRTDMQRPEPPKVAAQPAPTPPVAPPTAPVVPPAQRGRFIVLNFDNADIETVVHAASEIVGFNYVIGPGVSGKKVTVQTSGRIPQEDVFGVLLAILEVHGVTAVRAGNLYKIVPVEGARERAVPTIVGATPDAARTGDEVVTQIVPIRFAAVNELGTLLRPLISGKGTLIANRETGVLIITDSASNIARLLDIIKLVDVEVSLDELQIIPLSYADAAEMANILNQLFQAGRLRTTGVGGGAPAPAPAPGAPAASGATGGTAGADKPPLIVAERRSNSLIVNARRGELETIRRVIEKLDINVTGGRRVFIYYAENAKSKDLAATLNAIYTGRETVQTSTTPTTTGGSQGARPTSPTPSGPTPAPSVAPGGPLGATDAPASDAQIRFIADETTNAIIATTTPRLWADIEATIRSLDRMPRQVLIEVLVAEISLNDDTRLGIDWALKAGKFSIANATANTAFGAAGLPTSAGASSGSTTNQNISLPKAALSGMGSFFGPVGAGLTAFTFESQKFIALLNALASESRVNIVSNPHIMTSENKKAVINVSQSVPIITGQQTSTVSQPGIDPTTGGTSTTINTGGVNQTVEYKDAGVVLTVTPRIGERGTVALDVKQEVNAVGAPVPPTNSPSFTKREAETSVVLLNNQTLVLGGLIQDRVSNSNAGIPLLKDIPIIGWAFKSKDRQIQKTELLLLITPRVIGTAVDAGRITDEMRKVTPELNEAIRSAPRSPRSTLPPMDVPATEGAPVVPISVAPPQAAPLPVPAPTPSVAPPAVAPAPSGVPPIPPVPPPATPGPTSGVPPIPAVPPAPAPVVAPPPAPAPTSIAPAAPPALPAVVAPAPVVTPPVIVPPPVVPAPAPVPAPVPAPAPAVPTVPAPGVVVPDQPGTARPLAPARPVPRIGPPVRPRPPIFVPPQPGAPPAPEEGAAPTPTPPPTSTTPPTN